MGGNSHSKKSWLNALSQSAKYRVKEFFSIIAKGILWGARWTITACQGLEACHGLRGFLHTGISTVLSRKWWLYHSENDGCTIRETMAIPFRKQ